MLNEKEQLRFFDDSLYQVEITSGEEPLVTPVFQSEFYTQPKLEGWSDWVKIGEMTIGELDGPDPEGGGSVLDGIKARHAAFGSTVILNANGRNSPEANRANSIVGRESKEGTYVKSNVARYTVSILASVAGRPYPR